MSDIGTPAGGRTVLAVDAGNSKIDVALVTEEGRVLARGRGGPFQPQSAGVAAAVDALDEAVRRALGEHGPPSRPYADHVAAYCAGADLPVEEEALRRELLARGYAPGVVVGNDTFALLRAGASGPWGSRWCAGPGSTPSASPPPAPSPASPPWGRSAATGAAA
ncbi:hypothetical protein [Thermocatellispora tengchongensis]|uniref:hypothetical protein n=1 Tax=Thermocatellispora tengchongensis TaxID=1073253 RepID=UPI0036258F8A